MKLWIARDADDTLVLYKTKPWKRTHIDYNNEFDCDDDFLTIDGKLFPEVTFENSPQQVEVKLVKEDILEKLRKIEEQQNILRDAIENGESLSEVAKKHNINLVKLGE